MSYVDEVLQKVAEKNPGEKEFQQAVKEVLDSLRPVIEANEEQYRKDALLERMTEPERIITFRVPWVSVYSLTVQSDRTRVDFVFTHL